jgi:hypothetical protein
MGYKKGKKKYFYDPKSGRCISMHMQKYTLVTPNLIFYNEHVLLKVWKRCVADKRIQL